MLVKIGPMFLSDIQILRLIIFATKTVASLVNSNRSTLWDLLEYYKNAGSSARELSTSIAQKLGAG